MKTAALIDGFNLYHNMNNDKYSKYKWLNFYKLFRYVLGTDESLEIHYFTTVNYEDLLNYNEKEKDAKKQRHLTLIKAEEQHGIISHYGTFRNKEIKCPKCGKKFQRDVEKQTDVGLGAYLTYLAFSLNVKKFIILSADTDLSPAIKLIKSNIRKVKNNLLLPPGVTKTKLSENCNKTIPLTEELLSKCLFPPVFKAVDGKTIKCPPEWL